MGIRFTTKYYVVIFTAITIFGISGLSGLNSHSNEIIDDSIQEFTFGLVQFSSATDPSGPACSGNGIDDGAGSCICDEGWSGLQCEVSGG